MPSGWFNQESGVAGPRLAFHQGIRETTGRGLFLFDDFLTGASALDSGVPQTWDQTETGTGTSHAIFVPVATTPNGVIVGVAGATSANAQEVAGKYVGWQPSTQGNIFVEVRAKHVGTTTAADGDLFVGFSDVITATSGLSYDISLTSTVTATGVTEGAMIGYSSIPTSGALHPSSGNNYYGVFTTKATAGATPKAVTSLAQKDSSYHLFRVELDTSANATFFLDGAVVGATSAATTAATALTPYVNVIGRNSHACTATIDYIAVGGLRV